MLDKLQDYLDAEKIYEGPFNKNAYTGEYKLTLEEIVAQQKEYLLNAINRVRFHNEAADKGTVFNELVDCLHQKRNTFRKDIVFKSFPQWGVIAARMKNEGMPDEVFLYDLEACRSAADFFSGAVAQLFVKAILPTRYGDVELYGFIDELLRDTVYDLKTTTRYDFGKFEQHWQRYTYPWALIESGMMKEISAFEFSVCKWKVRNTLSLPQDDELYQFIVKEPYWYDPATNQRVEVKDGVSTEGLQSFWPEYIAPKVETFDYYPEYYNYDHKEATSRLTYIVESFVEFLEDNRAHITDKKIFNEA